MRIPDFVKYVNCPKCQPGKVAWDSIGNVNCLICGGESVVREDGKEVLRTILSKTERKRLNVR